MQYGDFGKEFAMIVLVHRYQCLASLRRALQSDGWGEILQLSQYNGKKNSHTHSSIRPCSSHTRAHTKNHGICTIAVAALVSEAKKNAGSCDAMRCPLEKFLNPEPEKDRKMQKKRGDSRSQ